MLEFNVGVEGVEMFEKGVEGGLAMGPDHENVINVS